MAHNVHYVEIFETEDVCLDGIVLASTDGESALFEDDFAKWQLDGMSLGNGVSKVQFDEAAFGIVGEFDEAENISHPNVHIGGRGVVLDNLLHEGKNGLNEGGDPVVDYAFFREQDAFVHDDGSRGGLAGDEGATGGGEGLLPRG